MQIVKVYTRYDTPDAKILVPYTKPLADYFIGDCHQSVIYDDGTSYKEHRLKNIEHGLEGVRYFHYEGDAWI